MGEVLDQPDFLNAAVRVRTALEPERLLDVCKAIEAEQGRELGGPRHGPRAIDLDLLLLGELELRTERLTLPHPEARSRRFVLPRCSSSTPRSTCPTARGFATPSRRSARGRRRSSSPGRRPSAARGSARRAGAGRRATPPGSTGGVRPGKSGDDAKRQLARGPRLDRRAQIVEAHQQAQARGDLDVGGVRLLAAEHAVGDPGVDLVEGARQRREVGADRLVGRAVEARGQRRRSGRRS